MKGKTIINQNCFPKILKTPKVSKTSKVEANSEVIEQLLRSIDLQIMKKRDLTIEQLNKIIHLLISFKEMEGQRQTPKQNLRPILFNTGKHDQIKIHIPSKTKRLQNCIDEPLSTSPRNHSQVILKNEIKNNDHQLNLSQKILQISALEQQNLALKNLNAQLSQQNKEIGEKLQNYQEQIATKSNQILQISDQLNVLINQNTIIRTKFNEEHQKYTNIVQELKIFRQKQEYKVKVKSSDSQLQSLKQFLEEREKQLIYLWEAYLQKENMMVIQ